MKVRDKQDRRIVFIFLTAKGEKLVNLLIQREEVESLAAGMDEKKPNNSMSCWTALDRI